MSGTDQSNKTENENLTTNFENRCIAFWVINKTDISFTMEGFKFMLGKWVNEPVTIPANAPKMLAFKACGLASNIDGTEGFIRYSSDQGKVKFTLKWNVPTASDNTLSIFSEGDKCNLYELKVENIQPTTREINPILTITRK